MHDKFRAALAQAEELGGWTAYTEYMLGMADTGDEGFDEMLAELFRASEKVSLRANQLCMEYGLPFLYERKDG